MATAQNETGFFNQKTIGDTLGAAMAGSESTTPSSPELESDSSRDSVTSLQTPDSPVSPETAQRVADSFVFAFDIDGVLVRGGKPIPEAVEAMRVLNGQNEFGLQMYVLFLPLFFPAFCRPLQRPCMLYPVMWFVRHDPPPDFEKGPLTQDSARKEDRDFFEPLVVFVLWAQHSSPAQYFSLPYTRQLDLAEHLHFY